MAFRDLHLLADSPSQEAGVPACPPCRISGCAAPAVVGLGFCSACRARYEARTTRRWRFIDLVCARLSAAGDPLFAVFGNGPRAFGAHVVAHLEELDGDRVHVPAAAVRDYVEELDELARRSA